MTGVVAYTSGFVSVFWTTLSITGVLTGLLAFALLHLRGVAGWAGWRWLFLIEGIITFSVGYHLSYLERPVGLLSRYTARRRFVLHDAGLGGADQGLVPSQGLVHRAGSRHRRQPSLA